MNDQATFILLMVATTYLSNDFAYSFSIAIDDFSYVANCALFESNILRFRALSSLRLFENGLQHENPDDEPSEIKENFEYLTKAIASLENAKDIYSGLEESKLELEVNNYGIALSVYAMGYIYLNFDKQLLVSNEHKCDDQGQQYLVISIDESQKKACKYF